MKTNGRSIFTVASVLLSLVLAAGAAAQEKKMYSWTDEDGTVHFSDMAPEGVDASERSIPQDNTSVSAGPYAEAQGPSAAQQRRDEIAQRSEEAKTQQAMTSAQCAAWQAEVDRLEPNRRVFYTDEQGETVRMDDVERTDRVAELKQQIARNCN